MLNSCIHHPHINKIQACVAGFKDYQSSTKPSLLKINHNVRECWSPILYIDCYQSFCFLRSTSFYQFLQVWKMFCGSFWFSTKQLQELSTLNSTHDICHNPEKTSWTWMFVQFKVGTRILSSLHCIYWVHAVIPHCLSRISVPNCVHFLPILA